MAHQPTADVIDLQVVRKLKLRIEGLEHELEASRTVVGHFYREVEELKAKAAEGATVLPMARRMSGARA